MERWSHLYYVSGRLQSAKTTLEAFKSHGQNKNIYHLSFQIYDLTWFSKDCPGWSSFGPTFSSDHKTQKPFHGKYVWPRHLQPIVVRCIRVLPVCSPPSWGRLDKVPWPSNSSKETDLGAVQLKNGADHLQSQLSQSLPKLKLTPSISSRRHFRKKKKKKRNLSLTVT